MQFNETRLEKKKPQINNNVKLIKPQINAPNSI